METVEFNRTIRLVTPTTLETHRGYYANRNQYEVAVTMPDADIFYTITENITVTVPTQDPDQHIMEFTIPDLGATGMAALELLADGGILNFLDVEIVPPTGETEPTIINL